MHTSRSLFTTLVFSLSMTLAAQPYLVKELTSPTSTSFFSIIAMRALDENRIVFVTDKGGSFDLNATIWVSDGTEGGTQPLASLSAPSVVFPTAVVNHGIYYFVADFALWRSDGTPGGTFALAPIEDSSFGHVTLATFGNGVIFSGIDNIFGREPWISDGTVAGTHRIADINPSGSATMGNGAAIGNTFYFGAHDGKNASDLWRTDGHTVTRIDDANSSEIRTPRGFTPFAGAVYFMANNSELWKTDGTTASKLAKTTQDGQLLRVGSKLMVIGGTIWVSDGTSATQMALAAEAFSLCGEPENVFIDGEVVSWIGYSGSVRDPLWRSDGTDAGTWPFTTVHDSASCPRFAVSGHRAQFMTAAKGSNVNNVWTTDGTSEGTYPLTNVNTNFRVPVQELAIAGSTLFFPADDGVHGIALWALRLPQAVRRRALR